MRCSAVTQKGEQCTREAEEGLPYCTQHINLYIEKEIEVDVDFPTESFALLYLTPFHSLGKILDDGAIKTSASKFNKAYMSFIFPGDKLVPYDECKSRLVNLIFSPLIFEECGKSDKCNKPNSLESRPCCYFNPYWNNGVRNQDTYIYKRNKSLNSNLNDIFNYMLQDNVYTSPGLEYQNELVFTRDVDLGKYLEAIYIPSDFVPSDFDSGNSDEIEDDDVGDDFATSRSDFGLEKKFNLQDFKDKYPQYIFVGENDKEYKDFINYKKFEKYVE